MELAWLIAAGLPGKKKFGEAPGILTSFPVWSRGTPIGSGSNESCHRLIPDLLGLPGGTRLGLLPRRSPYR